MTDAEEDRCIQGVVAGCSQYPALNTCSSLESQPAVAHAERLPHHNWIKKITLLL